MSKSMVCSVVLAACAWVHLGAFAAPSPSLIRLLDQFPDPTTCPNLLAGGLPRLRLSRVELRRVRAGDQSDFWELTEDQGVTANFFGHELPTDLHRRSIFGVFRHNAFKVWPQKNGDVRLMKFGIADRMTGRLIGLGMAQRNLGSSNPWSIGYALHGAWRGRGLGGEAVRGMLALIRSVDPEATVEISVLTKNVAGQAIARSCGFRLRRQLGDSIGLWQWRAPAEAEPACVRADSRTADALL